MITINDTPFTINQAVVVRVPGLAMDLPIYSLTWEKDTVECLMKCTIHI